MVVDLEYLGRESYMPLFVVLREGAGAGRGDARHDSTTPSAPRCRPRFVPNEIFQVAEIPRTLSGKKQELPIKKLLLGHPLEKVLNRDAMANPGCLDWYVAFAQRAAAFKPTCSRQKTRRLDGPGRIRDTPEHLMAGSDAMRPFVTSHHQPGTGHGATSRRTT